MYKLKQAQPRLIIREAEPLYSREPIERPEHALKLIRNLFEDIDREYAIVLDLDNGNKPIDFSVVSIGGTDKSIIPIPNVFKTAILSNASKIMLVHNHPAGSEKISKDDKLVTERVAEAGKILEIPLLDHIIIPAGTAGETYVSIRGKYPELFR